MLVNGEYVIVEKIQHEILEEPVLVYNFQVADFHTYYVGEQSVLVHNTCPPKTNNGRTTTDVYSFGNRSEPRGARPQQDFNVESFDSTVGPESGPLPKGASNVSDINEAPLSGHYHMLPSGTQMPDGLDIIADGIDVVPDSPHCAGHYTVFPTKPMTVNEFNELYKSLPWQYGGKK